MTASPAAPAGVPASVKFTTDTIEHVFEAARPPLAAGLEERFTVVQRPLETGLALGHTVGAGDTAIELLSITPDNELLHVRPDPTAANGWREQRVPLPTRRSDRRSLDGEVVEIDAFQQRDGIFALLHYRAEGDSRTVLPMRFDEDGGWRELVIEGNVANALYKTRQAEVYRAPDGRHFFYGVSTAYEHPQFVVVFETDAGALDSVHERVPDPQATYRLLPGDPGGDPERHACLRIDAAGVHLQGFTLEYDPDEDEYFIEWGTDQAHADLGFGALTAANVFPFPSRLATQSLMVLGEDQQLHYVAGYVQGALRSVKLSGGKNQPGRLAQLTLGRDEFERAIVFALDAGDRRLWVLRQQGTAANGDMLFGEWFCLGNRANVIASPLAMRDGAELFLVDPETRALEHMRQDRGTTFWANTTLLTASRDSVEPTRGNAHAVELEVVDANGAPVPNAPLALRSSYAAELNVNGFALHASAARWLPVSSDAGGRITVYMPAEDLSPPTLQLRLGNGQVTEIDPGARIAERLRGKDPRFKVDTPSLRAAGLIPKQMTAGQADAVAEMLRHVGRNLGEEPGDETRRLHIGGNGAEVRRVDVAMTSAGAADGFGAHLAEGAAVVLGGDGCITRLDWVGAASGAETSSLPILGDLVNMLKNAWDRVREFVVNLGKGIMEMFIKFGEFVVKIVVETGKGIKRAVEALFQAIGNVFGELAGKFARHLAEFVALLFGWEDIELTNQVLKFTVNQTFDGMRKALDEDAVKWIDGQVGDMRDRIDTLFDEIDKVIGPFDPTNAKPVFDADRSGQTARMMGAFTSNGVATRLVGNQMLRNPHIVAQAADGTALAAFGGDFALADDDPIKQFVNAIGDAFEKRLKPGVIDVFKDFQPRNTQQLFQGGVIRALRTLRPLFIFAIDLGGELVKLALRAMGRLIALIRDLFAKPVDIPLISALYWFHTRKQLTVLDLATLLVAIPMTLVYKLFNQLQAPFTKEHVERLERERPMWGELFGLIDKILREKRDRSGGIKVTKEMRSAAEGFAAGWRKPAQWLTLGCALTDFFHGQLMAAKHAVDSKEITGKIGTAIKIVTYLVKILRFVAGVPALLVMLADLVVKFSNEMLGDRAGPGGPFTLPYVMSPLSLFYTLVGFGLMIPLMIWPTPVAIFTAGLDMLGDAILLLATLYTVVALIHNGVVTGEGWTTSADALSQFATMMTTLPGLLSFIPPLVPVLDAAYGLGEVLLLILMIVDGATGYASGVFGAGATVIRIATT